MSAALILAAAAMGLAGAPHCAAMCGAACAAASGGARPGIGGQAAFQAGRLASYAAGGALAASSLASMAALAQLAPMMRPLWTLLHAVVLAIGMWMLVAGEIPRWMGRMGRPWRRAAQPAGWQPVRGPVRGALRPVGLGALWVAWPCGLLQSALMVAALADTPGEGAAAMAAFALASSPGLLAGPALWLRLSRGGAAASGAGANVSTWAARIAGASLATASAWALGHGLWHEALAWCFGG